MSRQTFRHFDGAVKVYLESTYQQRLSNRMPRIRKAHRKVKLFRVDGSTCLQDWLALVLPFFKGNEMVVRYFDPDEYERRWRSQIDLWRSPPAGAAR